MAESRRNKDRQNKLGKEDTIKYSKETILKEKQRILKIVECMIEKNISNLWFLDHCQELSQSDYDDVVEERSIDLLCGYPLCSTNIKILKQKFHISTKQNKVYDITERKYFCSNECYKASNFVKAQLSTDPFWMRERKVRKVKLLPDVKNSGSAGNEVDLGYAIKIGASNEPSDDQAPAEECSPSELLKREVENCCTDFGDLKIVENDFQPAFKFLRNHDSVSTEDSPEPVEGTTTFSKPAKDSDSSTEESTEESSSDSDSTAKFFPDYDNPEALSNKFMPVPRETQKAVMISPLNAIVDKLEGNSKALSLNLVHQVLTHWITEDTIKYLIGEHKLHSMKADVLFAKMTGSRDIPPEKLKTMKDEYVELCLKLDREEGLDIDLMDDLEIIEESSMCEKTQTMSLKSPKSEKPVLKQTRKKKAKRKNVTFAQSVKAESCDIPVSEETLSLTSLPAIDSKSQNTLRKQIVANRLKIAYFDLLPLIGQSFKYINDDVRLLMETLSLSPDNVSFKPKEWKLIALIIYRMLTQSTIKNLCDDEKFLKLLELAKLPLDLSLNVVDELIKNVAGALQLQRLQGTIEKNMKL